MVITHGSAPHLRETLTTFDRYVSYRPAVKIVCADGADSVLPDNGKWIADISNERMGFCSTTRRAWNLSRELILEYNLTHIFWLENDFRFIRPVSLHLLENVLAKNKNISQMALIRNSVNGKERSSGGLLGTMNGEFTKHGSWIEHSRFWTTNPSLIRSDVIQSLSWDELPESECEGHFGFRVKESGMTFGYWGSGEVWVEHMGNRSVDGFGY